MNNDVYTRGSTSQAAANTSPKAKTSQKQRDNSPAPGQNQPARDEVSLEPCLRVLRRVLTQPGKKV